VAETSDLEAAETAAINSTAELMSAAVLTEEHSERQNSVAVAPMLQHTDGHQSGKERDRGTPVTKPRATGISASNVAKVRPQQHSSNMFSEDSRLSGGQFDQMPSVSIFQVCLRKSL